MDKAPTPEQFMEQETIGRDEFYLIQGALLDPQYEHRTIPEIEEETGLPSEIIEIVLNRSDIARLTPLDDSEGNAVYVPRDQKQSPREQVLRSFL